MHTCAVTNLAVVSDEAWSRTLEFLNLSFAGNTVGQILAAIGIFCGAILVRSTIVAYLFKRLEFLTAKTETVYDEQLLAALRRPVESFIVLLGFFTGATVLHLNDELTLITGRLFQGASLTIGLWAVLRSVDVLVEAVGSVSTKRGMQLEPFLPLIKKTARMFTAVIGIVLVVQNLGYSVSSLLAGLGIGGLAVALAAQDTLANLFGSVTIAADLPFKVGDHVKTGSHEGIVESVGMRSTRIRTFENTLVQIPNRSVASDAIENLSRREVRRVRQIISLVYDTSPEQMRGIVADIRALLERHTGVAPLAPAVYFQDFGACSLDVLVVYHTKAVDFPTHAAVRQDLNLEIMGIVKRNGSAFAFPTQTVQVAGDVRLKK